MKSNFKNILSDKKLIFIVHKLVALQNCFVNFFSTVNLHSDLDVQLSRLGSAYGGWWVPKYMLNDSESKKICISAGLGHDVTFDKEILEFGFDVIGLDPIVEPFAFAESELKAFSGYKGLNVGLWSSSGRQQFFRPRNPDHDSWSATNAQHTSEIDSISFNVISLEDLIQENPNIRDAELRILKMDIEGAESEVIQTISGLSLPFHYLAIEMDYLSLIPLFSLKERYKKICLTRRILKDLRQNGYMLVWKENFNYFWVNCLI